MNAPLRIEIPAVRFGLGGLELSTFVGAPGYIGATVRQGVNVDALVRVHGDVIIDWLVSVSLIVRPGVRRSEIGCWLRDESFASLKRHRATGRREEAGLLHRLAGLVDLHLDAEIEARAVLQ